LQNVECSVAAKIDDEDGECKPARLGGRVDTDAQNDVNRREEVEVIAEAWQGKGQKKTKKRKRKAPLLERHST